MVPKLAAAEVGVEKRPVEVTPVSVMHMRCSTKFSPLNLAFAPAPVLLVVVVSVPVPVPCIGSGKVCLEGAGVGRWSLWRGLRARKERWLCQHSCPLLFTLRTC